MIGFGITGLVFFYVVLDGVRFLSTWTGQILYVISCLILKPILLPTLLPTQYFKSPVARGGREREGWKETEFELAVQDTNFLMTFTVAGVSAMSTFITVC